MIHTITIQVDTELTALKKDVRKKLMTGGAVVRLADSLSTEEIGILAERYIAEYQPNAISEMVLCEIARDTRASPEIAQKLAEIPSASIQTLLKANPVLQNRDTTTTVTPMTAAQIRRAFMDHLGDDEAQVQFRAALGSHPNLPDDVRYLLRRDR